MNRFLLTIILIISSLYTFAQASVQAKITPIEMLIGEQAQVTLTVEANDDAKVEFPTFQPRQMLVPGVEVIATQQSVVDGKQTLAIVLTAFDGNLYHLPPFKVKVNGKEYASSDLALKVVEVEVDTTKIDAAGDGCRLLSLSTSA